MARYQRARRSWTGHFSDRSGLTLIEMLIAVAITLVMMAAVVTLFANLTESVRNRRATIEMSGQLRHVRNMLQQDLLGATCPGLTWQRPESNHGYIEYVEGQYREGYMSLLLDKTLPPTPDNPEIDYTTSSIPSSNLPLMDPSWTTDGAGLGDYDDTLMLTVRNEHEPFVGRVPDPTSATGQSTIESPVAEVIWFAIENPGYTDSLLTLPANGFFGEPGMRTIYRRALLIAPWLDPIGNITPNDPTDDMPGVVRVLPDSIDRSMTAEALAALIAFQDTYDLSVRLEWDALANTSSGQGQWKIIANSLADLTKRENRFLHHQFWGGTDRRYPFAVASTGIGYPPGVRTVMFVSDLELPGPIGGDAQADAQVDANGVVTHYTVNPNSYMTPGDRVYSSRPFAYVADAAAAPATANAMLNDDGQVVGVFFGPVPLWGPRRGEDVMMTNVLGFDVRAYDPGAPIFQHPASGVVLEPTEPGWSDAYVDNMNNGAIGSSATYPFVGQGAYVDLGYGFDPRTTMPYWGSPPAFVSATATTPWFLEFRRISSVVDGSLLAPGFAVYDTWSLSYENNGLDEDGDGMIDEGTNGLDDLGHYVDGAFVRMGPDDVGERETAPPYDVPLRGIQVVIRVYETDARQIRQVRVNQHFVTE